MDVNYKMGDTVVETAIKEKDLQITISADMKVSEQCGTVASKGNDILGLIRRNTTYMEKKRANYTSVLAICNGWQSCKLFFNLLINMSFLDQLNGLRAF